MNETTSLVTGKDTLKNSREQATEATDTNSDDGPWQLKLAAVGVFIVFAAILVSSSPSTARLLAQPAESKTAGVLPIIKTEQPKLFQLSLEQNLELWDNWKEYLSWKDIWIEAQDTWKNDALDKATDEAWKETQENFADWFSSDNLESQHAQIWEDQTLEEGQEWWNQAQAYYNTLSAQNKFLWIHVRRRTSHRHHKMDDDKQKPLIYMNHSDAFLLLSSPGNKGPHDYSEHYFQLNQGLDAQINQAYCAVATSMAVLNSLRGHLDLPQDPIYLPYPYATQSDAFNECTNTNVIVHNDTFDGILSAPMGLNLDSAKALLECHLPQDEWKVQAYHVDAGISVGHMRGHMKDALRDSTSRVLVNYHRAIAGQIGGGHFSPIGAYNPTLDAFLIVDVAKYKYAPVWISAEQLYQSLFATDSCGHWKGPAVQASLPPQLLHPKSVKDLAAAMALLGCQAAPRGYIIVSKR